MNKLLWVGQAFLAIAFFYSGICKSLFSEKQLITRGQTGIAGLPAVVIRFIGISEILGSAGIILPWWTEVWPILTPVSAACFAVIMILAAPIHYTLKEPRNVAINMMVLIICLLVAWGRWQDL